MGVYRLERMRWLREGCFLATSWCMLSVPTIMRLHRIRQSWSSTHASQTSYSVLMMNCVAPQSRSLPFHLDCSASQFSSALRPSLRPSSLRYPRGSLLTFKKSGSSLLISRHMTHSKVCTRSATANILACLNSHPRVFTPTLSCLWPNRRKNHSLSKRGWRLHKSRPWLMRRRWARKAKRPAKWSSARAANRRFWLNSCSSMSNMSARGKEVVEVVSSHNRSLVFSSLLALNAVSSFWRRRKPTTRRLTI